MHSDAVDSEVRGRRWQFSLPSLFALTAIFSGLLALCHGLGSPPGLTIRFAVTLAILLVARGLLFQGRHPYRTGFLVGTLLGVEVSIEVVVIFFWIGGGMQVDPTAGELVLEFAAYLALGGLTGLLVTAITEFVFWLTRKVSGASVPYQNMVFSEGPIATTGTESVNRRRLSVVIRYTKRVACLLLLIVCILGVIFQKPLRIAYHRHLMATSMLRAVANVQRLPLSHEFHTWWHGSPGYYVSYELARDRLVDLGALEYRHYQLQHIPISSDEATIFWQRAWTKFGKVVHAHGAMVPADFKSLPTLPAEELHVWDRPDRMDEWDEFVKTHDVPDLLKKRAEANTLQQ